MRNYNKIKIMSIDTQLLYSEDYLKNLRTVMGSTCTLYQDPKVKTVPLVKLYFGMQARTWQFSNVMG